MDTPPNKDFEVAIVGGGVSGLVCAIALQRAGVPVQLFEAAAAFGEIGAGIGLGSNAVRVLKAVGLLDEVLKKIHPSELRTRGFIYYNGLGDNQEVFAYDAHPEDKGIGMHRAIFLEALVPVLEPQRAHFNKRCTSIVRCAQGSRRLVINFQDGTSHETDVVIGADGIKSAVRSFVLDAPDDRVAFSNTVAYRGLVPYKDLQEAGFKTPVVQDPACFVGPSKHFILFPIKNGEVINVVAFVARYDIPIGSEKLPPGTPWVETVPKEAMEKEYEGWGPDIAALMKCMPETPSKWSIHVVHPPLDSFVKGHVALIGDAAHAMLPHLGAGAGQGLEDAYIISRLLGHPETQGDNLEAVLETYSRIRRPRAQMVWSMSRAAGAVYDWQGAGGSDAEFMREELRSHYDYVWQHDIEADVEHAISELRTKGAYVAHSV
ncbi:FAD/NAD(P)-binding domain-containing protein [Dichomitus squalens LYAD-421 SS1]|uniref:FAD/NAD(P)-binding domain-containing protein n=1 Tax=Dichomitus squalens TaxID=114155 RepID=A0A4Q9MGN9_9APHY|nr:FAD/NAD(P)-binding domain-containing protein [Dichomitus squalens LYAD-421 SS1]EJF67164.1 FAD/NAD(P)-binding domain-containing protein [Dichomitus squalens LYAD-421 SS1]TBU25292.1 FAD/NAD(P)-binding domain-containing protein [Dichomitus squalens]